MEMKQVIKFKDDETEEKAFGAMYPLMDLGQDVRVLQDRMYLVNDLQLNKIKKAGIDYEVIEDFKRV